MTSKSKSAPTSPYTAPRREQFRNNIMPGILAGEATPKFAAPIAANTILEGQELMFVGGTTTHEPKLEHTCHHDLWVLVKGTQLVQVFAVYGEKDGLGVSRKGKIRAFGLSPALTEARQRAVDMGICAYSVLEAHSALEKADAIANADGAPSLMPLQIALIEVEETVLRETLARNTLLKGFIATCAFLSSQRLTREERAAMTDCLRTVEEPKQFNRLKQLIGANAICNRTPTPSEDYVRSVIQQASAQTTV